MSDQGTTMKGLIEKKWGCFSDLSIIKVLDFGGFGVVKVREPSHDSCYAIVLDKKHPAYEMTIEELSDHIKDRSSKTIDIEHPLLYDITYGEEGIFGYDNKSNDGCDQWVTALMLAVFLARM